MKMRSGTTGLGEELGRWLKEWKNCVCCNVGCVETRVHFLKECEFYKNERKSILEKLRLEMAEDDWKVVNRKVKEDWVGVVLGEIDELSEDSRSIVGNAMEVMMAEMWGKRNRMREMMMRAGEYPTYNYTKMRPDEAGADSCLAKAYRKRRL